MSDIPKVSVIIPVYNTEKYLKQCLDSAVNQTYKDIEIICVNDGSTDSSLDILQDYQKRDCRIQVVDQENAGLSSARNAGLLRATGDYVQFLDSDDLLKRNIILQLVHYAERLKLEVLLFDGDSFFESDELVKENSNYLEYYHRKEPYNGLYSGPALMTCLRKNDEYRSSVCLMFLNRKWLFEHNIFFKNGILHEDNLFTFICLMRAVRCGHLSVNGYLRRVRENSIMTTPNTVDTIKGYFACCIGMLNEVENCNLPAEQYLEVQSLILSMWKTAEKTYRSLPDGTSSAASTVSLYEAVMLHIFDNKAVHNSQTKPFNNRNRPVVPQSGHVDEAALIRSSWTYRIGRFITFIPRKIRGGIWCYKENGFIYTIQRCRQKFQNIFAHSNINPEFAAGMDSADATQQINMNDNNAFFEEKITHPSKFDPPPETQIQLDCIKEKQLPPITPKVSVIIPVYNTEKYLEECLESLIHQTIKDIEIICIDDGSTDGSMEILEKYAKQDTRLQVLTQTNLYAGVARNRGIEAACGDYVIFLDADDFFKPDMLQKLYLNAIEYQVDVVLCGAKRYNDQTGETSSAPWYLRINQLPSKRPFSAKDIPAHIFDIVTPCPWTKLFRREFILQNHLTFQDTQNSNDVKFVLSALAIAQRITAVEEDLVFYRVGHSNSLQARKNTRPLEFLKAYMAFRQELEARELFQHVWRSYLNITLSGCIHNLRTAHDEEAYLTVYCALRDYGFNQLGLTDYSEESYNSKQDYNRMTTILTSPDPKPLFKNC